jgi:hypothetical protein
MSRHRDTETQGQGSVIVSPAIWSAPASSALALAVRFLVAPPTVLAGDRALASPSCARNPRRRSDARRAASRAERDVSGR